jgi:hypothetical protein
MRCFRFVPLHRFRPSWLTCIRTDAGGLEGASAVSPRRRLQPGRPDRDHAREPSRWPPLPRMLHPCGLVGPLTPFTRCCRAPDAFPA